MASINTTGHPSSSHFNRLDTVQMSPVDREHARAMMRQAEAFAELLAVIHKRVRATARAVFGSVASLHTRLRGTVAHTANR